MDFALEFKYAVSGSDSATGRPLAGLRAIVSSQGRTPPDVKVPSYSRRDYFAAERHRSAPNGEESRLERRLRPGRRYLQYSRAGLPTGLENRPQT